MKLQLTDFLPVALAIDVDAERDRRAAAGFDFAGHRIQCDDASYAFIVGNAGDARDAIEGGAAPGDLRWADPDADFAWITAANVALPMDARTMVAMGRAASLFRSSLARWARSLKDRIAAGDRVLDVRRA